MAPEFKQIQTIYNYALSLYRSSYQIATDVFAGLLNVPIICN